MTKVASYGNWTDITVPSGGQYLYCCFGIRGRYFAVWCVRVDLVEVITQTFSINDCTSGGWIGTDDWQMTNGKNRRSWGRRLRYTASTW